MARSRIGSATHVPQLAFLVARAAARSYASTTQAGDVHTAVIELARITRLAVLERGIVASDDLRAAVDDIASRHLKRAAAERQLSRVLGKISDRQLRNAIEVAHDQVLEPSEIAHYYAGLMAGFAFLETRRGYR